MSGDEPPREVLAAAGLEGSVVERIGGGTRVWRVTNRNDSFVLRRSTDDATAWVHPVLTALSTRFPVPEPRALFAGRSVLQHSSGAWEALSFMPGREIGFDEAPALHEVGAFLATFHEASIELTSGYSSRADGTPLRRLDDLVDWNGARITMRSTAGVATLRQLVDQFTVDLERVRYDDLVTCVVHGDPTTFNVLAGGTPLRPSALIDFDLADVGPPVADIAFCLWRSGRPAQAAKELDLGRVRDFVRGYRTVRRLGDHELDSLPALLRGRGLQMLVKRTQRAIPDDGPLTELLWIDAHQRELVAALEADR